MTVEVNTHIRAARAKLGVGQRELARRAGISTATLSRIERGEVRVGLDTAIRLAAALGIPATQLLDETAPPAGHSDMRNEAKALIDALPEGSLGVVVDLLQLLVHQRR
jgi:transcriptional regulator with XRE-family HTH domain